MRGATEIAKGLAAEVLLQMRLRSRAGLLSIAARQCRSQQTAAAVAFTDSGADTDHTNVYVQEVCASSSVSQSCVHKDALSSVSQWHHKHLQLSTVHVAANSGWPDRHWRSWSIQCGCKSCS